MEKEKITSDVILGYLKELVESKKSIAKEEWLNCAFKLNLLRIDEAQLLNKMRQTVAKKKFEIMKAQDKKNVAAVEVEIDASDECLYMRDQEDKVEIISEFIRIAKKNSEDNF